MKKLTLGLMVVGTLFILMPSAFALNCTLYQGEQQNLCNSINPLPISESDKISLMQPDVYNSVNDSQGTINLSMDLSQNQQVDLNQVYEQNITLAVEIGAFIAVNYFIFSFLTKPSKFRRWLTADS